MFKPSELFNLEKPELWKEWKQRLQGTGNLQINSLLYSMGSEAEKVFVQLKFAEGEADQYDKVLEKLEDNFTPKVNIIHKRSIFHRRDQGPDENMECYVRALHDSSVRAQ